MILLVDDSDDDAELLRIAARDAGLEHPIRSVDSGEEALELLLSGRIEPVLIVLDIKMPGMNGLEVLRRLRGDPAWRDAAVVILSGSDIESERLEACRLGCEDFITKPSSLEGCGKVARRIKELADRPSGRRSSRAL